MIGPRSWLPTAVALVVLVGSAGVAMVWAGDIPNEDANEGLYRARWAAALWSVVAVAVVVVAVLTETVRRRPPLPLVAPPPPPMPPPMAGADLGALAAGLAHELGQPLSAARVDIEGLHLLRQLGREPTREHEDRVLSRVGTCILAMTQTVEHLRSLAVDPVDETLLSLDLRDAVEAVLSERDRWLRFTETGIAWDRPAQPVPVIADPAGLRLVLVNLLRNAAEAVAAQDPVRRVVRVSVGPGPQVTVQDSGPGIPEALLSEVFEPFRSARGPGRGVGLALARASALRMGGSLTVASEPGLGACFTLRLGRLP